METIPSRNIIRIFIAHWRKCGKKQHRPLLICYQRSQVEFEKKLFWQLHKTRFSRAGPDNIEKNTFLCSIFQKRRLVTEEAPRAVSQLSHFSLHCCFKEITPNGLFHSRLQSRLDHERPNMIRDFQANIEAILPLQLVCLEFDVPLISRSLFAATREIVDKSGILNMLTRSSG